MAFHIIAILGLLGAGAWGLYQVASAGIGFSFLFYLGLPILAIVVVPLLAYRLYALWTAYYILERDGIRLRWGLRLEDIPMTAVAWVHSVSELEGRLPLPLLRWPGAVVGMRHFSAGRTLQGARLVEYLAGSASRLVLIGAGERAFGLSPADPIGFLYAYERLTELGSLTPLQARSVYPTFLLGRAWHSRPVRGLMLSSWILSLVLLTWISLAIPGRDQVHLGFRADGSPGDLVPAARLMLLPVLEGLMILVNFFLGLFFYRREESQYLSYLLWGSSVIVAFLFLLGAYFIL